MTDLNKLKPCPFCAGEAESRLYDCEWFVQCIQCFNSTAADHAGEDEAVAAWNRRVEPDAESDQLRAEVEALRLDNSSLRGSCKALGDENKHLTRRVKSLAKALAWFSSLQHIGMMKPKWLLAILAKEGNANG